MLWWRDVPVTKTAQSTAPSGDPVAAVVLEFSYHHAAMDGRESGVEDDLAIRMASQRIRGFNPPT